MLPQPVSDVKEKASQGEKGEDKEVSPSQEAALGAGGGRPGCPLLAGRPGKALATRVLSSLTINGSVMQ